jgi:hypothetical protein
MPRKTRRRIRRKRVRGTRRVRTYYRGGNRRYYSQGGDMFGEANNMFSNAAAQVRNFADRSGATNLYNQVSTSADSIVNKARGLAGLKTNDSQPAL